MIGTRCIDHVETIGVPITEELLGGPAARWIDETRTFTTGDAGCALVIALPDELQVTWDGGQSFARYATGGRPDSVASVSRMTTARPGAT